MKDSSKNNGQSLKAYRLKLCKVIFSYGVSRIRYGVRTDTRPDAIDPRLLKLASSEGVEVNRDLWLGITRSSDFRADHLGSFSVAFGDQALVQLSQTERLLYLSCDLGMDLASGKHDVNLVEHLLFLSKAWDYIVETDTFEYMLNLINKFKDEVDYPEVD